ncbi:MAG: FitA-like ribbon-helix-helix domain-containing protein [Nocardioides sp.]
MATQIIIRNLDPQVVALLSTKAKRAGQSLQAFMADLATSAANSLSNDELMERARDRIARRDDGPDGGPTRSEVLAALAECR